MLASTKELLHRAQKGKYAVGHFNINNLEILQGVVQAGVNLQSPLILATSEGALAYAGMDFLYSLVETASHLTKIPLALHLDHGRNLEIIQKAIRIGYSSVMIDASHLDFEKNISLTKKVVQRAHQRGVSVEAELGTIGGEEDSISSRNIIYTNPRQAKEFVDRTNCDFLTVAIGTSHGAYKFHGPVHLQQELLKKIKQRVKIPLVLHGASCLPSSIIAEAKRYGADLKGVRGVPDKQIRSAIKNGISKVNTDTDLRIAFDAGIRKIIKTQPREFDPRNILSPARDNIKKIVEHRIKLMGSVGKK